MKRIALLFFLSVLFFLSICPAFAQKGEPGFGVEFNTLAGKIIKHSAKFTSPIPPLSTALDLNFVWRTYGRKEWEQRRNYPEIGIGAIYTDYGNNLVFGKCLAIYGNIQVALMRRGNLEWTLRLGDGLGYVTKIHTPTDTVNSAIGSHFNDFVVFMTDVRYRCNDHWNVQLGGNFTHISNGNFHQPNLGINMVGAHIGIQYFPVTNRPKPIIRTLPKLRNRYLAELRVSTAYKQARTPAGPILPSYNITGFVSRRWLGKNKMYAGMDYAYHHDIYAFLKYYGVHDERNQRPYAWDGTFFVGNEFLLGRVGLFGQVGFYYHQTFLKYDFYCEKLGVNIYLLQRERGLLKEVFVSGLLLTHGAIAEYGEFGLGVSF